MLAMKTQAPIIASDSMPLDQDEIFVSGDSVDSVAIIFHSPISHEHVAVVELLDHLHLLLSNNNETKQDERTRVVTIAQASFDPDAKSERQLHNGPCIELVMKTHAEHTEPIDDSPETFHITRQEGGAVTITGSDDRGLIYGVYELLEYWGVRWFAPGLFGLHIPNGDCVRLPRDFERKHTPSIPDRGFHLCGQGKDENGQAIGHYDHDTLVWMRRNRMNFKPIHNHQADSISQGMANLAMKVVPFGHSYSHWFTEDDFVAHPEFFALTGGARNRHAQLCLSNQSMREALVVRIVEYLQRHPNINTVSIAPNDGYHHCECIQCRSMDDQTDMDNQSVNRRHFRFASDIAQRLKKSLPQRWVSTLSYANYLEVDFEAPTPVAKHDGPASQLAVSLCVTRSQSHALDDDNSPSNVIARQRLIDWRDRVGRVYISEYHMSYGGHFPRVTVHAMAKTIRDWHRLGIHGYKSEIFAGDTQLMRGAALHLYFIARLTNDVGIDVDALLDDAFDRFYGRASKSCRVVWDTLTVLVSHTQRDITALSSEVLPELIDTQSLQIMQAAASQAIVDAQHSSSPMIAQRVAILAEQIDLIARSRQAAIDAALEPRQLVVPRVTSTPSSTINCSPLSETGSDIVGLVRLRVRADLLHTDPPATYRMAWDKHAIHVVVRFETETRHDVSPGNPLARSHADMFISPDPSSGIYYQFIADGLGQTYTARCHNRSWDSGYRPNFTVTAKDVDGLTQIMWRIPYDALETVAPKPGDHWAAGLNVSLNHESAVLAGWPYKGAFHDIEQFGTLLFQ